MDYTKLLEESYAVECRSNMVSSRHEYLSEFIFDMTTYDSDYSEMFGREALAVCETINDGTTFEYIKDPERYRWYLMMVNTAFFRDRLDWGSSIRGAWWCSKQSLRSCGLWYDGRQVTDELEFSSAEDWATFVRAMVAFAKK